MKYQILVSGSRNPIILGVLTLIALIGVAALMNFWNPSEGQPANSRLLPLSNPNQEGDNTLPSTLPNGTLPPEPAAISLIVDDAQLFTDDFFTVTVSAEPIENLTIAEMALSFDPSLVRLVGTPTLTADTSQSCDDNSSAFLDEWTLSLDCSEPVSGSPLALWTLNFEAGFVSSLTQTDIEVSDFQMENVFLEPIPASEPTSEVSVNLNPPICGDINGDRVVDNSDMSEALNIAGELQQATPRQLRHGDLNRNAGIDVIDTVIGLQAVSEGSGLAGCGAASVRIADGEGKVGDIIEVEMALFSPEIGISGFIANVSMTSNPTIAQFAGATVNNFGLVNDSQGRFERRIAASDIQSVHEGGFAKTTLITFEIDLHSFH